MLSFIKKLFGSKPAEPSAPYKVEAPAVKVDQFPFPSTKPKAEKKTADKKPAVKKTTRKPKAPKAS